MNATNYFEQLLLKEYFIDRITYVGLFHADPGETGTASPEVTGAGYQRQRAWWRLQNGMLFLDQHLLFAGLPSTTVGAWGVFDSDIRLIGQQWFTGNLLLHTGFASSKTINSGEAIVFAKDILTIGAD